jgi:hypothetical protein
MNKRASKKTESTPQQAVTFMFGKQNYMLMLIGIAVIILGFILMSGSDEIFNSTKLTVAPIVVMIGFVIEIIAIMYKPAEKA